jgi:hypothetical protein
MSDSGPSPDREDKSAKQPGIHTGSNSPASIGSQILSRHSPTQPRLLPQEEGSAGRSRANVSPVCPNIPSRCLHQKAGDNYPSPAGEGRGENPRPPKARELNPEARRPMAAAMILAQFRHPFRVQNRKGDRHPGRCPGLSSAGPPGRRDSAPEAHRNLAGGSAPVTGRPAFAPEGVPEFGRP